jgi:hypothetical protein
MPSEAEYLEILLNLPNVGHWRYLSKVMDGQLLNQLFASILGQWVRSHSNSLDRYSDSSLTSQPQSLLERRFSGHSLVYNYVC